jgi:ubiquitin-conjugating enzyme E2 O
VYSQVAYQVYSILFNSKVSDTSTPYTDTVLVRAYEDRTDLLRCLIIGPENTPYEDAPFVIDWMLDSNFPQSPPIAHFHSWTNGNGRGQ